MLNRLNRGSRTTVPEPVNPASTTETKKSGGLRMPRLPPIAIPVRAAVSKTANRLAPFFKFSLAAAAVLVGASFVGRAEDPARPPAPRPAAKAALDVEGLIDKSDATKLTPEKKALLTTLREMLEPDKLGGADKTFNLGDIEAVVEAMMKDKPGLGKAVAEELRKRGEHDNADIVENAFNGGRGFKAGIARTMVNSRAPKEIKAEMATKLEAAGVSSDTATKVDDRERNLTFAEMKKFGDASDKLAALQKKIGEELGYDLTFPNGISAEAVDFMLSGKPGIPPGAQVVQRTPSS